MVPPKGAYNVAVMFDRCRVTSCSCTCGAGAKWCTHVVALCLFRIHNVRPSQFIPALSYTPSPLLCCMPGHSVSPFPPLRPPLPSFSSRTFSQMVLCSFRRLQSACGLQSQSPCLGYKGTSFKNLLSTLSVSSLSRWVRWDIAHCWLSGFTSAITSAFTSAFLFRPGRFGFTCALFSLPLSFPSDSPHSPASSR